MQLHEFRSLTSGVWMLILPHFGRKWYFYVELDCKVCTLIYFKARIRHTLRSLSITNIFGVMRKNQYCIVCIFINEHIMKELFLENTWQIQETLAGVSLLPGYRIACV